MPFRLCFATNNPHKLTEVKAMLPETVELLSLGDIGCYEELAETQNSLEGNSYQKASYVHQNFQVDCFADDTGLEVPSLGGAPGVYSARYAGLPPDSEKNIRLLLDNLDGTKDRPAQFRSVISLILKGVSYQFEGVIKGIIHTEKKGTGGFGYDPVFKPKGNDKTFAEMSPAEKNAISHRAIAIKKLAAFLSRQLQ